MRNWFIATTLSAVLLSGCSGAFENKAPHVAVEVQSTSDALFDTDVLKAKEPVLVDFYATWCPPCKRMAPIVDEVAEQFQGKVKVLKVNIDENPGLARALGIESIPTLVVFKDGHPVQANVGLLPKSEIISMVESALTPNLAEQGTKTPL
ncbi:MAG: thioredoxin [Candidatus Melainabacteria bacterium]|nr:MAG: thioredoxin [Candidatus Melainabacteria bacterium]